MAKERLTGTVYKSFSELTLDHQLKISYDRDKITQNEDSGEFEMSKEKVVQIVPRDFIKGYAVAENGYCADLKVRVLGVIERNGAESSIEFK